jgi:peptide/nickel transport system substrate-binding protein
LRQLPGYSLRLVQYTWANYLVFNLSRALFADPLVRQALALALDRRRLVATTYSGTAVNGDSFIPPSSWAYTADNGSPPPDVQRARDLLDRAGWIVGPDGIRTHSGRRLAFTITTSSGSTINSELAQQLQAQWRAVGADAAIQTLPINVLRSPDGLWTSGKFDIALVNLIFDPDPDREANLGSQFIGPRGFNDGRYVSALSDRLSAEAVAVYPHDRRKPFYAQLQRLWNHDLPVLPIAWPQDIYAVNDDLHGFRPEPVNSDFWNIQKWEI